MPPNSQPAKSTHGGTAASQTFAAIDKKTTRMFGRLYLDYEYIQSLVKIGCYENWITKSNTYGVGIPDFKDHRNMLKSSTLLLLTLYDEIEATKNRYNLDWSKFVDANILRESSSLVTPNEDYFSIRSDHSSKNVELAHSIELAISLFRLSFTKFLNRYKRIHKISPRNLTKISSLKNLIFNKLEDEYIREINDPYFIEFFDDNYEVEIYDFCCELELTFVSIIEAILMSLNNSCSFASNYNNISNRKSSIKKSVRNYNQINSIVKTKFTNEITYLPYPETLSDVAKFRSKKELKRFRIVLSNWFQVLEEGNVKLEAKMRKDILKANKELKNLTKYKEFSTSPINFFVNGIGGHIPILSNILTLINSIGYLYERHTEKKYGWTKIDWRN